jgi:uncharacterized YigZ family protein
MKPVCRSEYEIEVKKSRFICILERVESEEEARALIAQIRKEHPDARHVCSAMIIGDVMRSSDDGEPAGTAGRPMLEVLVKHEMDCVLACTVRYFGGTLLGKGGLVRAYSQSVKEGLAHALLAKEQLLDVWQVQADYEAAGKAEAFLRSRQVVPEAEYGSQVVLTYVSDKDWSCCPIMEVCQKSDKKLKKRCVKSHEAYTILSFRYGILGRKGRPFYVRNNFICGGASVFCLCAHVDIYASCIVCGGSRKQRFAQKKDAP